MEEWLILTSYNYGDCSTLIHNVFYINGGIRRLLKVYKHL